MACSQVFGPYESLLCEMRGEGVVQTGQAALHAAIESGSIDIVRALKRHGASFTDTDRDGNNGLHYVALHGRVDLLSLADDGDWRRAVVSANLLKSTPLHTLLEDPPRNKQDAAALVSTFMLCGADSVLPDAHGRTPLELAAVCISRLFLGMA
jgi:ankyrin repeat protein